MAKYIKYSPDERLIDVSEMSNRELMDETVEWYNKTLEMSALIL